MTATLETINDRPALRFTRRLAHPVEGSGKLLPQPGHFLRAVVAQDGLVPGRVRERRGDDVLRQLVQPVGELTFRLWARRPAWQPSRRASAFCASSSLNRSPSGPASKSKIQPPVLERDVSGARRLHDPVERHELGQGDLSICFSFSRWPGAWERYAGRERLHARADQKGRGHNEVTAAQIVSRRHLQVPRPPPRA
jgi:hypothetical protein